VYSVPMTQTIILGYIRVSTDKQTDSGAGLEGQRSYLKAEATHRGALLEIISEVEATSGKSTKKRPALMEALDRLDRGEAHALAVSKLDRLSRSVADFLMILERSRKGKWALIIGDLSLDTSTPMGEAMATISATFAQLERRRIGERTKEALAVKKAEGVILGSPRTMPADIRARILSEVEAGKGYREIVRLLNAEAIPPTRGNQWHASTIRQVHLSSVA
jgi:DNA invertase Pin-like site-specific DNA recombinase